MGWELRFMEWGKGWWGCLVLDQAIPWITHLGSLLAVLIFITVSCVIVRRKRTILTLLFIYGILAWTVYGLKYLIARPRPFQILGMTQALTHSRAEVIDPSFPSAHSAYAFMMATLLAHWFPKYRVLFYALAGLIGWTRIYLFLHFPTDVITGGLLGYGVTKITLHFVSESPVSNRDLKNRH